MVRKRYDMKINYVKNYIALHGIVAYYLVQYTGCNCCAYSAQPIQLGVLDSNGVPVPIFGTTKYNCLQGLVGKKLDHDTVNGLVKNGVIPFGGDWEQPHGAAPYDHAGVTRLH